MLEALGSFYGESDSAIFLGSYDVLSTEPDIPDKHCIQIVTHDIWGGLRAIDLRASVSSH